MLFQFSTAAFSRPQCTMLLKSLALSCHHQRELWVYTMIIHKWSHMGVLESTKEVTFLKVSLL